MFKLRKKKAILSFDYELFFGDRSGTVKKSLIEPTNTLLNAMDSVGAKGNFFIDWQMLKYLKKENKERTLKDYELIRKQIHDIINRGHRIELHIHPHWVDARYNGDGTWDFSEFRHYSLNSFSINEIIAIFNEGNELLRSIAREVDPKYELCAFRAGGWAVQPFDKVRYGMDAVGIKIDSSVMPGYKIICQDSRCDFLNAPVKREGYYEFSNDVCIEDTKGKYIEIPITTIKPNFILRLIRKTSKILGMNFGTLADGTHYRSKDIPERSYVPEKKIAATISYYNPLMVALLPLFSPSELMCFNEHPKDVSKYATSGIKALSKSSCFLTYKEFLEQY